MPKPCFLIAALVTSLVLSVFSFLPAQAEKERRTLLSGEFPHEGRSITVDDWDGGDQATIVREFMRTAFPVYMRLDDPDNVYAQPDHKQKLLDQWKGKLPAWLLEFALREKGVPAFDAISRWKSEVTIGVGLPPPNRQTEETRRMLGVVEPVYKSMYKNVREATGLDFWLLKPDQEREDYYAKIRIVPLSDFFFPYYNRFKTGGRKGGQFIPSPIESDHPPPPGYSGQMSLVEGLMLDSVRFTPRARAQVEGYFVTDKDNNIEFAVCYLWPQHKGKLLQTLVAECLLRALGLPEQLMSSKNALLGRWNTAHDAHSKRLVLDGAKEVKTDMQFYREAETAEREGKLDKAAEIRGKLTEFPHDLTDEKNLPPLFISDWDVTLLRILYCPDLKAGMSRAEVMRILPTSNACLLQRNYLKN